MNSNVLVDESRKSGRSGKWLVLMLMLTSLLAFFLFASAVSAHGTHQQIAGVGYFAGPGECEEAIPNSKGNLPDFALVLTGDLEGCLYTYVEAGDCSPNGVYIEDGNEKFVGTTAWGDEGSFDTIYRFVAHFGSQEDCINFVNQVRGRCMHPIVAGTGTGDLEGVFGRLDFVDDVVAGTANYTGSLHLSR